MIDIETAQEIRQQIRKLAEDFETPQPLVVFQEGGIKLDDKICYGCWGTIEIGQRTFGRIEIDPKYPKETIQQTALHEFAHYIAGVEYAGHGRIFFGCLVSVVSHFYDGQLWRYNWNNEKPPVRDWYHNILREWYVKLKEPVGEEESV